MKTMFLACGLAVAAFNAPAVAQSFSDLKVGRVTMKEFRWTPLQKIRVSSSVRNAGSTTLRGQHCGFYLSRDQSFSRDDRELAGLTLGTRKPGSLLLVFRDITVPMDIKAGRYYLLFVADTKNVVRESNERNNVASAILTGIPKPDVAAKKLQIVSGQPAAGQEMKVQIDVQNYGGSAANLVETGIYLSTNSTISDDDFLLGGTLMSSVASGQSIRRVVTVQVPAFVQGKFFVGMIVDQRQRIVEVFESNNKASVPATIAAPASNLRRLEFQPVLTTSAGNLSAMTVVGSAGGEARMAVTAPALAGKPFILLLSRQQSFAIDDLTHLGFTYINTRFFANWAGTLSAKGQIFPNFRIAKGTPRTTGYIHAFFNHSLAQPAEKPLKVVVR